MTSTVPKPEPVAWVTASHSSANIGHPQEQFEIDDDIGAAPTVNTSHVPDDTPGDDEPVYPTGLPFYATLAALAIVIVTLGLDFTIVIVAVPSISDTFHTLADIGWYVTALRLAMCSFMFLAAKAYTIFPIKKLFCLSVAMFAVGNAISTFATTSSIFVVGRAICGLGAAGVNAGFWTIFTLSVPMRRRALYGAVAGGLETIANVAAPLIGGPIIDAFSWRACFGMLLPLSGIAVLMIWFLLPPLAHQGSSELERLTLKQKIGKLDLLGTGLFVPAVVSFLLALQWAGTTYGWQDARIIVLFVTAILLFAAFGWWQWRIGERASLPVTILSKRSILAGAWFGACANGTLAVVENYMAVYFQGVRMYSAAKSGVLSLPMIIGLSVSCLIAGAGTTAVGYYYPFMIGTTLIAPVAAGLLTTLDPDSDLAQMLSYQGLLGFAVGLGIQGPQVAAQTVLPAKDATIGMAVVTFGSQMGPVLFVSAAATLFKNRLGVEVNQFAPGTNITSLENLGLSDIRTQIGGDRLKSVLTGYDEAVTQTLYLPVALTCLTLFGTLAMERVSVKKKQS